MFKRFKILFVSVSIAISAMAQEVCSESLDSIINALELKEVIVSAKKNQAVRRYDFVFCRYIQRQ